MEKNGAYNVEKMKYREKSLQKLVLLSSFCRYRCEFDCQTSNERHVTRQYEAVVCLRQSNPDFRKTY